ncbi:hypothetical protein [Nocardia araoensis]|uniref:hypothetical protein n=1 Tax=Nocardia araoensis TaxID=228600 RepID=UPI0012F69DFE|nr:hypothetical protein [Nocardia araoensis]
MKDSYTITISDARTGVVAAIATVEIDASGVRLAEVRAETTGEAYVPEDLARVDFPLLVRTANMLSGGRPQISLASKLSSARESVSPRAETGIPPTASESIGDAAVSEPAPKVAGTAQQRAQRQQEQRAGAPSDFGVTYWRLGSIAKVAKHYDIPHHVAQDWIKSLQKQGKLANPWPSKTSRSPRSK